MKFRQCRNCSGLTEVPALACKHCDSEVSFPAATDYNTIHRVFPSGYFRDIDYEPVYCKDRKDLLRETRKRGQVSPYAED